MKSRLVLTFCGLVFGAELASAAAKPKQTDLEKYLAGLEQPVAAAAPASSAGSLYSPSSRLAGLGLDLRAANLNDLITIIVEERASAVSKGTVKSTRSSNVKSSIADLYGPAPARLGRLAGLSTSTDLAGEGATTRETTLHTSITARVVQVMPNGNLVIEGVKNVTVNAETQAVVLRGIVRPADITTGNAVSSERIAAMEIRVNGKGVVGDAIRRPFFLYRLLLGILPF
jgi:flagellar L-ring protein FlgH